MLGMLGLRADGRRCCKYATKKSQPPTGACGRQFRRPNATQLLAVCAPATAPSKHSLVAQIFGSPPRRGRGGATAFMSAKGSCGPSKCAIRHAHLLPEINKNTLPSITTSSSSNNKNSSCCQPSARLQNSQRTPNRRNNLISLLRPLGLCFQQPDVVLLKDLHGLRRVLRAAHSLRRITPSVS